MEQQGVAAAPRTLKERQRREREALILQVAEEVLTEKGYYETSIDEIAARVGIAKGTVYLHFPSKEDLVIAIMARDIQQLVAEMAEIAETQSSEQSKLERILHVMYGKFAKRMQLISAMIHSTAPLQLKAHGTKVMGLWEQAAEIIQSILEKGKEGGEFRSDIPTLVMVGAFFSLLSPGSYARLMAKGQLEGEELARYLGCIYYKGIANLDGGSR